MRVIEIEGVIETVVVGCSSNSTRIRRKKKTGSKLMENYYGGIEKAAKKREAKKVQRNHIIT